MKIRTEREQAAQDFLQVLQSRGIPPNEWAMYLKAANAEGALDSGSIPDCVDTLQAHINEIRAKYGPGIEGPPNQKG